MTSQTEKFKIGVFVVVSIVLAMSFVIWLGASRFFEDSTTVVAYFTESVQGLESDSPVKFRGVPVGRVRTIRMAPDGRLIEVVIGLNRNFKVTPDLGIKMNLLGLTGLKYLEIDSFPYEQRKEPTTLDFQPRYQVLATYPSDMKEFGSALDILFQKVKHVDAERISSQVISVSAKLDKVLSDAKVDKLSAETSDALREVKDTARKISEEITRGQPGKHAARTLEKAGAFLDEASQTVRTADKVLQRTDKNFSRLTQKLDQAADNLNEFTKNLREKPLGTILWGQGKESSPKR
jgi:phospholipid/cholesterol/gamma-HCH transport system substrate-binding protein